MRVLVFGVLGAIAFSACAPQRALAPIAGQAGPAARAGEMVPAIVGQVDFGGSRQAQATMTDVGVGATVSLIDTASSNTVATTLTTSGGVFVLPFDASFAPVTGATYFLEAVKGLNGNAVGSNAARVRTIVQWSGTAWLSIATNGILVSLDTTALSAIYGLKLSLPAGQQIAATSLIGALTPPNSYGGGVANCSVAEYNQTVAIVIPELLADRDPLAGLARDPATGTIYRKFASVGVMAPDDRGDAMQTHDYLVTKSGITSTFVWIPVFTAYQLINPGMCGAIGDGKPVGYWVGTRPTQGTEDTDWAMERFGGFYAGKFEASHADAVQGSTSDGSGATEGTSSTLKVAQFFVPWTNIDWDAASSACLAYDAHCHLLGNDEWTAMVVWATINDITVYGNDGETDTNASYTTPASFGDPGIHFLDDPTFGETLNGVDRALTGSATKSTWPAGTNLTTHTGTTAGVYDLDANVQEWTAGLGQDTSGNYILNDVNIGVAAPLDGYISSLCTDPRLRRQGVPGTTGSSTPLLGNDYLWQESTSMHKTQRGAAWRWGNAGGGLWSFGLWPERTSAMSLTGFRPALRF